MSAENAMYFALFRGTICTANEDGTIPLNSRYIGEVNISSETLALAMVKKANAASELLVALRDVCERLESIQALGAGPIKSLVAAHRAIAKAWDVSA